MKPAAPPPELEVVDLHKRFGAFVALRGGLLAGRARARVHALLGENGAGKSTLVKCIMGYHQADAGEVRLDGRVVTPANPRARPGAGHRAWCTSTSRWSPT